MSSFDPGIKPITMPRVLIVGTSRGVGVSTIVLGLLVTMKRQGVGIGSAKIGVSLAEPTHHRRVMGRLSYTFDPWLLNATQGKESLARLSGGTEIALFEGDGALFDPFGEDAAYRNAGELAVSLKCPIVLVVDARGAKDSIAAVVHGFNNLVPGVKIAGVIANRVSDDEQDRCLRKAVESLNGPRYLGGVRVGDPHQTGGTIAGLHMYNPSALTRNRVIGTGKLIEASVDIAELRRIGEQAGALSLEQALPATVSRVCKVAVADDQAFHLTCQDNLDLIRRAGGELVAFSPIADRKLPSHSTALYLPGGYVHLYAADLANNKAMLEAIRNFAQSGGVVYAEGGAISYLSSRVTLTGGESFEMVGLLRGVANAVIEDTAPPHISYQLVKQSKKNILGEFGAYCRGFRDSRWVIRLEQPVETCFEVEERGVSLSDEEKVTIAEGFCPSKNVLITRLSLHWASEARIANNFIRAASECPLAQKSQTPS